MTPTMPRVYLCASGPGGEVRAFEHFDLAGDGDADVEEADLAAIAGGGLEEVRGFECAEGEREVEDGRCGERVAGVGGEAAGEVDGYGEGGGFG
ncbi:hypothetical protein [Sphingomonas aerolata]|uniref:hypothetical protein n=1 Tax=Sphingomonas aerolata TaxID=185951 RepID=UPI002FE416B3